MTTTRRVPAHRRTSPRVNPPDQPAREGSRFARYGRDAHRGWIICPNERLLALVAWPSGFAKRWKWGMGGCPKKITWPDIDDVKGCKACISAMLDRDQSALEAIVKRFPSVNIGFEEFLQKLRRGESTGCYARLLCVKPLQRGRTLYMELIVKSRFRYIVGTIRDHRRAIIMQKIYAKKKNPRESVPSVDIQNPLAATN